MGHDARLKRARRKARELAGSGRELKLLNPVSHHFKAFIFGNATKCERVLEENSAAGQHLVLCGAGPTLNDTAPEWAPKGDQLWGCNSALPWLVKLGLKPTHGITVDQTTEMLAEWYSAPDVEYLLASSVHPHLVEFLASKGRQVRFFHNYVGIRERPVQYDGQLMSYEDWMYSTLYLATVRCGSGLNTVTRAIDAALYMGFGKITVLGADCAMRIRRRPPAVQAGSPEHLRWLKEDVMLHADGGHALASNSTSATLGGEIDGRYWETKPDMMITAVWLVQMRRKHAGRVELIGDTLPNALKDKDEAYLDRLPHMVDSEGKPIRYFNTFAAQEAAP